MNKSTRLEILRRFQTCNPTPTIELLYNSPFELLIAVLLSARSTDRQVNKVTRNLFKVANTPQKMLSLGIMGIKNYIKSVGCFNNKSKNIFNTSRLIVEKYHGVIPDTSLLLEELPGIGHKSANVILNVVFGHPVIAVDTHVFRFCNRSRFAIGSNVRNVEKKLLKVVPNAFKRNCHLWFVFHGRYICTAKKLFCTSCLIHDICEFREKLYVSFFLLVSLSYV